MAAAARATQSNGRCPNGAGGARNTSPYAQGAPTPDGPNTCAPPPQPSHSVIVISQIYGGGGNAGAPWQNDFVELYNRGASPVDIGGWSLQYAAATGSGWDFNRQPLGGTIAPGEYYLIALASGGDEGAVAAAREHRGRPDQHERHERQGGARQQLHRAHRELPAGRCQRDGLRRLRFG